MDKFFSKYFARHIVACKDSVECDICVVIPVYLEEDELPGLINSLNAAAGHTASLIRLIMVVNYGENASHEVIARQNTLVHQIESYQTTLVNNLRITILKDFEVPQKHAGVGHARKVGMDYAAFVYAQQGRSRGIIVSLDADCTVGDTYFEAIEKLYITTNCNGGTIYFEHPLTGELAPEIYSAIAEYELHLRYYVQALRFAGFPFAFHTVGSCFTVTAEAYVRAGGMPSKQAGEDFYFLQKVIPQGNFSELNTTVVIPSSRPSARVPFGTGPSVNELMQSQSEYLTYNLQAFIDLKEFLMLKDQLYHITDEAIEEFTHQLGGRMRSYLANSDFFEALGPVNDNCSSLDVFRKRFYEVFNAFRVVKYLNYTHAYFIEKTPVFDAATFLYELSFDTPLDVFETAELLMEYRQLEREHPYSV